MSTKTQNGRGAKIDAAQIRDTATGAKTLEQLTEKKSLPPPPPNPMAERLKKIYDLITLHERRKRLVEMQDEISEFESALDGESDTITLVNSQRGRVEIKKPDAVKKVVSLLKQEVDKSLFSTEAEIMSAAL